MLGKIRGLSLTSWNFIGHDPEQFRHYGPMAQDFFAAFGHDGIGTIGTDTTITSTDMDGILMIAAQALEKRTVKQEKRALELAKGSAEQNKRVDALTRETNKLRKETYGLRAENTKLKARLEALERRMASPALVRAE